MGREFKAFYGSFIRLQLADFSLCAATQTAYVPARDVDSKLAPPKMADTTDNFSLQIPYIPQAVVSKKISHIIASYFAVQHSPVLIHCRNKLTQQ